MNTALRRCLAALAGALLAFLAPTDARALGDSVGQTASVGTRVDGVRVPSGTTLLSPALVETSVTPAVIHLKNGRVLAFDAQTVALVERVDGGLRLAVRSGSVTYGDEPTAVTRLERGRSVVFDQEGRAQEVVREEQDEERLCELQDWTVELWQLCTVDDPDDEDCEWELIEVPIEEVPDYLDITAYLACKDRNPLDLSCDCEAAAAFLWWKAGVGAVAATTGYVIYDRITEEDDERPASPTTPK